MGGADAMPAETLPAALEEPARRDRPAVAGPAPRGARWSLSRGGLSRRVRAGAAVLAGEGVDPGSTAAVWLGDGPERLVAELAVLRAGAAVLPLAPDLPGGQAREVLERAGANAGIAPAEAEARRRVLSETGGLEVVDPEILPGIRERVPEADEALEAPTPEAAAYQLPTGWGDDTEVVPATHREVAAEVRAAARVLPATPGDRVLRTVSPTHAVGRTVGTLAPLAAGAATAFVDRPWTSLGRRRGEDLLRAARRVGADVLVVGSGEVEDAWRAVEAGQEPGVRRVVAVGDPPPDAARAGLRSAGVTVAAAFGPAQVGPAAAIEDPRAPEAGLAPIPGLKARAREGVLEIRGPAVRDAAARDGWASTGWVGRVDERGHLAPEGRDAERIERGDEGVAAEAVEAALRAATPLAGRVVAFDVGREVGAAVVPDPGAAGAGPGDEAASSDEAGEGDGRGKGLVDELRKAASGTDPAPDRVAVRGDPPRWEEGERDHAGEVRRGAVAEAWRGDVDWSRV